MQEAQFNPDEFDAMFTIIDKFDQSLKNEEELNNKRAESLKQIVALVLSGKHEGLTRQDFSDLLISYNLLINAEGILGNTCAVLYYIKEIDKENTSI